MIAIRGVHAPPYILARRKGEKGKAVPPAAPAKAPHDAQQVGREPRVPRTFSRLDVAVRMGQRLFKVRTMTLVCQT